MRRNQRLSTTIKSLHSSSFTQFKWCRSNIKVISSEEIERYFFGRINSSDCIDESLRDTVTDERVPVSRPAIEDFRGLVVDREFYDSLNSVSEEEIRTLEAVRKYEKFNDNKNSRLRIPGKSFRFCLEVISQPYNDAETKRIRQSFIGNPANIISKVLASLSTGTTPSQHSQRPVILVPDEVFLGNLNMENAVSFLNEGRYIQVEGGTVIKKKSAEFVVDLLGEKVHMEIADDFTSLKNRNRMSQVVAIFIKGNPHQFKDIQDVWGVTQIAKLFKRVRSYYLTFADVPIHPDVQKWNVKILKIDRFARHKDLIVQQEFLADFKNFLLSIE